MIHANESLLQKGRRTRDEHLPQPHVLSPQREKQNVFNLRRITGPQRDTVYSLTRNPNRFIRPKHSMYFRDAYGHLFCTDDTIEVYHKNLDNILQVYFSYSSFKWNKVLKHLTILAAVILPPVIVASVYGMHCKHCPEWERTHGYPFAPGLCLFSSAGMFLWMKLKKRIEPSRPFIALRGSKR